MISTRKAFRIPPAPWSTINWGLYELIDFEEAIQKYTVPYDMNHVEIGIFLAKYLYLLPAFVGIIFCSGLTWVNTDFASLIVVSV